ncbi:MAG: hypothetical protein AB8H79_08455 [Myxococcota bacterium]
MRALLYPSASSLTFGTTRLVVEPRDGFGLIITGDSQGTPAYLDAILGAPPQREAFFSLVDQVGLVVCRNLDIHPKPYRPVGGRRSQRRLSQGEFFHHDGCSTPTKPRIVEIRCPDQRCVRTMATATAPFADVVRAMLCELPKGQRRSEGLADWARAAELGEPLGAALELVQGRVNRVLRQFKAESARSYFLGVDHRCGAFFEPWTLRESRFMANNNDGLTVQHRRACHPPWAPGTPNGHLLKRWPNEELAATVV